MAYIGLPQIIVAVILTGAAQTDAYCESVEVEDANTLLLDGIYKEMSGIICDNKNVYIYDQRQMFLYQRNGYWMISEYDYCLEENNLKVWARVLDSASRPEYIRNYWQEWYSDRWYTNVDMEIDCYEKDSALSTATIVGISLASIFGVVVVISIVTGLVKSCKARAATRQTRQASSTTTRNVSNSYGTPQANATSESYQPPAYEPPGYINPHFEPDSCDVRATAPVYEHIPHGHFDPPPSYEDAVNNHKQISTISNMEQPPFYNTAHLTDATDTAQALSVVPPSENQFSNPPPSIGDAELSTESVISESSISSTNSFSEQH